MALHFFPGSRWHLEFIGSEFYTTTSHYIPTMSILYNIIPRLGTPLVDSRPRNDSASAAAARLGQEQTRVFKNRFPPF